MDEWDWINVDNGWMCSFFDECYIEFIDDINIFFYYIDEWILNGWYVLIGIFIDWWDIWMRIGFWLIEILIILDGIWMF